TSPLPSLLLPPPSLSSSAARGWELREPWETNGTTRSGMTTTSRRSSRRSRRRGRQQGRRLRGGRGGSATRGGGLLAGQRRQGETEGEGEGGRAGARA
ncbi:unnamed protein product, partial [Prorocentrum cordatum]